MSAELLRMATYRQHPQISVRSADIAYLAQHTSHIAYLAKRTSLAAS